MKVRYLINIVSLMRLEPHLAGIPECFFRRPNDLINDALEIGYNGVQVIPMRGLTGNESGIELFEFAWNPVNSLWQAIRHQQGASGMPSKIQDWVVSPNIEECCDIHNRLAHQGIQKIYHDLDVGWHQLVEVSPKLSATPTRIVELSQRWEGRLVIDTFHLREKPSSLGNNETEWSEAINTLVPYVDVIHVNPGDNPEETRRFLLDPPSTITGRLLRHLLTRFDNEKELTIVIETRPILKGDGGIRQAKEMLTVLKSMIN